MCGPNHSWKVLSTILYPYTHIHSLHPLVLNGNMFLYLDMYEGWVVSSRGGDIRGGWCPQGEVISGVGGVLKGS